MSLKNFHIFFIVVSIVFSAGFGIWCLFSQDGASRAGARVMGTASLIAAVGLVMYLFRLVKKLQEKGIL
jgi:hypothetical protein